jgi:hypothetical protein
MTRKETGRCLCGKVQLQANNMSLHMGACHCDTCRKWGGGPYLEADCGSDVVFSGEEHITVFNSSEWAERGFCRHCGTHLFYRLKETQDHMVPVGLFDNDEGLTFTRQVFVNEKPSYYSFSNKTDNISGDELFAQFAPSSD